MSSTFSFTDNASSEYVHQMNPHIILHLYRINHGVAILDFTDEMNVKINIPTGIIIYTNDYQTNQKVVQKPITNFYTLGWTDNYIVEYNNKLLLDIKNKRNWDITVSENK